MANQLDELNPEIREEGIDTNVIVKKLPATVGAGSVFFEIMLWVLGIIPGVVFLFMKINAQKHFDQLQQKIQRNASQIDNYLEQRVVVLQNCARLLDKAIDLDKSTFENVAKYRSGNASDSDVARNEMGSQIDNISKSVNIADTINMWNRDIFAWPTKKIVAAKNGYTTRIPFAASKEIKEKAKEVFF